MKNTITNKKTGGLFLILFAAMIITGSKASAQCTVDFTWIQTTNNVISFTNTSTGLSPVANYFWNFADGTGSNLQNPVHTFALPGTYAVCLTVVDSNSLCNSTICHNVTVTGVVICNLTAAAFQAAPASCSTCADGSAYVLGSGGTTPYTYTWNTFPPQTTASASGLLPGTYTVCITDANNCTACASVTVYANSCTADFTWNQTANNTISFTNTSTGGSNPSSFWFFGDGSTSYGTNAVHYYTVPGTYTACLKIQDSTACNDSICHTIAVTGVNCNLSVSLAGTNASCGTCNDGSVIATATGGTAPYNYQWNNGATTPTINGLVPGIYSVCVTDINGCTACDAVTVGPNALNCFANFSLYADSVVPHTYWGINQSFGAPPIQYLWSWGDGTSDTAAFPSHTYAAAGYYTICLTLSDSAGCSSTYCDTMLLNRMSNAMITVNIIPPAVTGIAANEGTGSLPLYPNPAKDYVVVRSVSPKEKLISAAIFNSTGTVVAIKEMKNNTFDVSNISQGIYFAKFLHPNGKYSTAKLVIMR
jgi:PKD repeat protein